MPRPRAQILAIFDAADGDNPAVGTSAAPGPPPGNGIGFPNFLAPPVAEPLNLPLSEMADDCQ